MDKLGSKTIIGAGASFNGKIINARVIEINGKMNADLTAEKATIGEVGHFDGAIRADLVVVSGHYEGKMQAGSVWATSTASISGKLHYETLQMDRGAALNCHIVHRRTLDLPPYKRRFLVQGGGLFIKGGDSLARQFLNSEGWNS